MKIFITSFVLMMVMAVTYAAHVGSHSRKPASAEGFAKASNDFGFGLLKQIVQHQSSSSSGSKNVLFSPYSVAVALSMVHQGSQGSTAEQFKRVLNYDQVSQLNNGEHQAVANSVKQLQEQIKNSYNVKLEFGNMMVVDHKMSIKDEYRKTIEQYYESEVMSVDFSKESKNIMEQINEYISNKTYGLINPMLERPPSPNTVLALINAVYFKGEWLKMFDPSKTEKGVFYDHQGHEYKNVEYMHGKGEHGYVEIPELNSDLIIMRYRTRDVAFYSVLPRERNCDLSKIRQSLNSSFIDEIIGRNKGNSVVYFPKIELSTSYQLPGILNTMGIQDAFTGSANFSGISNNKSMKIDEVIHKAKLIINEKGTEASASTYSSFMSRMYTGIPRTIRFDHPSIKYFYPRIIQQPKTKSKKMKIFITSFVLMMVMAVTYEARNVSLISHIVILGSARGFAKASNDFGFHLLQQIQHHSSGSENVFFSPYSVAVALSMVYQGTQGYTAEQFKRALNYDKISQLNNGEYQAVANSVKRLRERMNKAKHIILEYGNMLVVDNKKLPIKDEYRKTIEQYYDSQIISVDLPKESRNIMERINQYVSNKTHGLINPMLEQPPSPDTVLALINAVYFKGEWLKPFNEIRTKEGIFYDHRGNEYKNVKYMNGRDPFEYVEIPELNSDLIKMPYKGSDVVFYGLLPRERDCDLSKIRQSLNSSFIDEIINRTYSNSGLFFPKIKLDTSYRLPEILKSMGIQDAFTGSANFSGISDNKSLKIDDVLHKAKLIVDEQGTEAAAGTYIGFVTRSGSVSRKIFRFDHPFLYFIRHQTTGQILFLGEIHNF
uniref:Uncharacterized protein LOC113794961 n=1 Tax=Dermatophagoides pteronyssinus TaxID=6956 RepID=A0A6P6Y689_DERPT|nr:uncharacterized protein LOC113794961 [Dermatophagoides pteronyssinus]